MITDADVKKLSKVFATKADLNSLNKNIKDVAEKIERSHTKLSTSIDHAQTGIEIEIRKVERKTDDLKERIDIFEDNITGEVTKLQDENFITSTYRASIEDHEQRIINLESK